MRNILRDGIDSMKDAKNCTHNRLSADWQSQIDWLRTLPATTPTPREESVERVKLLIARCKVVTVAMVVKELGMQEMKVRRILDEITPAFARLIPGRPAKWRKANARNG